MCRRPDVGGCLHNMCMSFKHVHLYMCNHVCSCTVGVYIHTYNIIVSMNKLCIIQSHLIYPKIVLLTASLI